MRHCPDVGAWRAHLDGESPIDGGDVHLASCRECAATLAELRGAAGFARARLAVLDRTEKGPPTGVVQVRRTRTPSRWKGVAAAALAIVFLMTPFGQTAAQAFLDAFRVERFDLVQVSAAEAVQAADALEALGTLEIAGSTVLDFQETSLEEAERRTGLRLPVPSTVDGSDLDVAFVPASTIRWTLDAARIDAYLSRMGAETEVPDGIGGSTVILERSDAIVATAGAHGSDELLLGVSGPVGATAEGATLEEIRSFLLEVPGVPESLVMQLSAVEEWRTTLPVPVPLDGSVAEVDLGGTDAVEFAIDGLGSGFLWIHGEQMVGVVGSWQGVDAESMARELAGR